MRISKELDKLLRQAFLMMGYHEKINQDKITAWLKPIGYQCFCFNSSNNKLTNFFMSAKNQILVYESKIIEINDRSSLDDILIQIKNFECYTRTDFHVCGVNAKFELDLINI